MTGCPGSREGYRQYGGLHFHGGCDEARTETFQEKGPNITVNYSGTGSGSGTSGFLDGTCDIGLSGRELKQEESDLLSFYR